MRDSSSLSSLDPGAGAVQPELLAKALHRLGLAADAQERALAVGALLQHLAAGEDLAAQVLRRPGQEQLGLDQALAGRTRRSASRSLATSPSRRALITMQPWVLRAQRRFASPARRSILLNTSRRGTSFAPISSSTSSVTASWRSKPGSLASTTWSSSDASSASSSVDLNEATSPCGRFLMKPTVSLTSTRGTVSGCRARTVVSSVANSLFGDQHLAAGERAHQGGLAGVGVADQRHAREALALAAPGALRLALDGPSRRAPSAARRCGRGSCAGRARRATRRRRGRRCRCARGPSARPAWPPRAGAAPCSPGARSRPARARRASCAWRWKISRITMVRSITSPPTSFSRLSACEGEISWSIRISVGAVLSSRSALQLLDACRCRSTPPCRSRRASA